MKAPRDTSCQKCKRPKQHKVRWLRDGLWVGRCCRGDNPRALLTELERQAGERMRRQLGLFSGKGGRRP